MSNFAVESYGLSKMNMQANVLVEYQRLIKQHYGTCKMKSFLASLQRNVNEIPLNERCQIPDSPCDINEK